MVPAEFNTEVVQIRDSGIAAPVANFSSSKRAQHYIALMEMYGDIGSEDDDE